MIEKSGVVVEPEQERADHVFAFVITKAADDAVSRTHVLDLLHAKVVATLVGHVATFGDDAVESPANLSEPFSRAGELNRRRRQAYAVVAV